MLNIRVRKTIFSFSSVAGMTLLALAQGAQANPGVIQGGVQVSTAAVKTQMMSPELKIMAVTDQNGNFYAGQALQIKPLSFSITVGGIQYKLEVLKSRVVLRENENGFTNTYDIRPLRGEITFTEWFKLGLDTFRTYIRDSKKATDLEYAKVEAIFTAMNIKGHQLGVTLSPHFRTTLPYPGQDKPTATYFRMPIVLKYEFTEANKWVTLGGGVGYNPVVNVASGNVDSELLFNGQFKVALYKPNTVAVSSFLFFDFDLKLVQKGSQGEFKIANDLDDTSFNFGAEFRF